MVRRLPRREFGWLSATGLAGMALAGCGPARAEPTPEALDLAERLAEALRAIPSLTGVESRVTTHVYTKPDVVAWGSTLHEPDRDELVAICEGAQTAVDAHQLEGHLVAAWVATTVAGADAQLDWKLTTAATATAEQQADAVIDEIGRGAQYVSITDRLSSGWADIDDTTALHPAPAGMRLASRSLRTEASPNITTVMHAGEQNPGLPVRLAIEPLLDQVNSVNLVAMDGAVKWQLSLTIDDPSDPRFVEGAATMLVLLRDAGFAGRQTVEFSGPWGVTLLITRPVSIMEWRFDRDRTLSEGVITDLLTRVNA